METNFFEIYRMAITEFKDPILKELIETNPIYFSEVMYNFLENAIAMFTDPKEVELKLRCRTVPQIESENFLGDGATFEFSFNNPPDKEKQNSIYFEYKINGVVVDGEYSFDTNIVTLTDIPFDGDEVVITWCDFGNFDFILKQREKYVLAQFIIASWSNYIANDKLDIIRLLGDTDFKLTANANTTQAKTSWNIVTLEKAQKTMNKYAWDCIMNGDYLR